MRKFAILLPLLLLFWVACPGKSEFGSLPGELDQKCYPDGSCNEGLYCVAGTCRDKAPEPDSGVVQDAGPSDTGIPGLDGGDTGPGSFCGDGVVDVGEDCDDGELLPTDSCSEDCRSVGATLQRLSAEDNHYSSFAPRIVAGGAGDLYMVWQQCNTRDTGDEGYCDKKAVMVARRRAGSLLWDEPVEVSPAADEGSANATSPDLQVAGDGTVHIVWADDGDLGTGVTDGADILYRTWDGIDRHGLGDVQVVTHSLNSNEDAVAARRPRLVLGSDGPMVAFALRSFGTPRRYELYLAQSQGEWSVASITSGIENGRAGVSGISFALDANQQQHLVWADDRESDNNSAIYYWNGSGEGRRISPACTGKQEHPAMVLAGGQVAVAYVASGNCAPDDIESAIGFIQVGVAQSMLTTASAFAGPQPTYPRPAIAALDDGRLVVAWQSLAAVAASGDDADILYRVRDRESSWGDVASVSQNGDHSQDAAVAVSGNVLNFGWAEKEAGDRGDLDIYYDRREVAR